MSPEKIDPGLQNLMKQGLLECFNDTRKPNPVQEIMNLRAGHLGGTTKNCPSLAWTSLLAWVIPLQN